MSDYSRIQVQIASIDDQLKHKTNKGISFVRKNGNHIEYINIPNVRQQTFRYFYNPSKLTNDERKRLLEKRKTVIEFFEKPIKSTFEIENDL
jgi:hypothetical protein